MKTAVITGISRGIGRATAEKFLAEGWRVVGTYRKTPIEFSSENLSVFQLDLGMPESIARAAAGVRNAAPHVDVLVNNGAILIDQRDTIANAEKVRATLEADIVGVVDFTERLLPLMSGGSHIVNVDSSYGAFSVPIDAEHSTGYRIAKAALNMYTRTLAFRLGEKGITVSSLDPGWVNTEMGNSFADDTDMPDREPADAAKDIFILATMATESGQFWRFGKTREW